MACVEYPLCNKAYYEKQSDGFMILKCSESGDICAYSRFCSDLSRVVHSSAYTLCVRKGS